MSRPKLPKGKAKGDLIFARVSKEEKHKIEALSKKAGYSNVSEYLRAKATS